VECPHCRSRWVALSRPQACPKCGRPLQAADGAPLRTLDLDFEALRKTLRSRSWERSLLGGGLAAGLALAAQLPPVAPPALVALYLGNLIWARLLVARAYREYFGPKRRLVTRWVTRFALVIGGSLHFGAPVPVAGVLLSPAVFIGLCWGTAAYLDWHLAREHQRLPIAPLESMLLLILGLVVLVALSILTLAALGLVALFH
jgi:hypothetical protein